ncbi:MAG TPA: hypothetical protein VFZ00_05975 [Solirubrobacter sp.]|nr:hypothetical protein [Solirubrobacter sp.]
MRFKTRRVALLAALALAVPATVAGAQILDKNPDEGPVGGGPVTVQCGQALASTVQTNNGLNSTSSVPWVNLPTAQVPITVPANSTRCIKVLFTAETTCSGQPAAPDLCYVQATIDGVPMSPFGQNFQAIDSDDPSPGAHAYEWVRRVGPGAHLVEIQQRVGNPATTLTTDDWTMDVQVHG